MLRFRSDQLIFLISQPRAGSTMLQRVLAGHVDVHTTAEPWLMLHPTYALRQKGHEAEYGARTAYRALQDFLATLDGGSFHYFEGLRRMGLHLYGTACRQAGARYFLDKTPRYFFIVPELARIFPDARYIILLRNPLAVLASTLRTWVQGDWIRLSRHHENLVLAPRLLLEGIDLLEDQAMVVHYENLVQDPASQVSELCQWLGLTFHQDMVEYGSRPSFAGRYGDPAGVNRHSRPTTSSLDRWLELGHSQQERHLARAYLAALGADVVSRLGYDADDLRRRIEAVPLQRRGLVVPWNVIFPPCQTSAHRLLLILAELLQRGRLRHACRQVARLLLGRL